MNIQILSKVLQNIISDMGITDVVPQVEIPLDLGHGDYTSNVAMQLAKRLKKSPLVIAQEIVDMVKRERERAKAKQHNQSSDQSNQKLSPHGNNFSVLQDIEKVEIVAPGFLNFHLALSCLNNYLERLLIDPLMSSPRKRGSIFKIPGQAGNDKMKHQRIMVEFAHPNTHKAFHIGHLRNITTGESIVRLLEALGHEVIRVNYQGDVGMHIAKVIFALSQISNFKFQISNSHKLDLKEKVELLGKAYASGSKAFEDPSTDGETAKETIKDYNFLVYAAAQRFQMEQGIKPSSTDYLKFVKGRQAEVEEIYELWKETRQWSLDYFASIYKRVGTTYQRLYFESECLSGVDDAREAVKSGILQESEGAIIFNGKPYAMDTRVFVNSLGLPTYEAKELALAQKEFSEFGKLDQLIHVVGPEQASFFNVTFKVEELLGLQKNQQLHLIYGWVKLKHGKMSSRSGNVVLGEWLIDEAKKEIYKILEMSSDVRRQSSDNNSPQPPHNPESSSGQVLSGGEVPSLRLREGQGELRSYKNNLDADDVAEKAAVAAVKYSFLKVSTRQEIAFDIEESVNFQGDSGPYLQYTYARARSVLRKANNSPQPSLKLREGVQIPHLRLRGGEEELRKVDVNQEEKLVLRKLYQFPEVVIQAATNYTPNVLCEYLYDLASFYNTFYNKHSILEPTTNNPQLTTHYRLALTEATAETLRHGLYLLGIETLERM